MSAGGRIERRGAPADGRKMVKDSERMTSMKKSRVAFISHHRLKPVPRYLNDLQHEVAQTLVCEGTLSATSRLKPVVLNFCFFARRDDFSFTDTPAGKHACPHKTGLRRSRAVPPK